MRAIGGHRSPISRLIWRSSARANAALTGIVLASALFALTGSQAVGQQMPVTFRIEQFEDPQMSDILFAQSWPRLIEENNRESARFFPTLKPLPGHNSALSLSVAKVPIPSGEAIISIYTGPFPHCQGVGEAHNSEAIAIPCPARMTILRGNTVKTIDLGMVCRVGPVTSSSRATAVYDPKMNAIRLSATVEGKRVDVAGENTSCERTIPLS